jgi:hypothetical protein
MSLTIRLIILRDLFGRPRTSKLTIYAEMSLIGHRIPRMFRVAYYHLYLWEGWVLQEGVRWTNGRELLLISVHKYHWY